MGSDMNRRRWIIAASIPTLLAVWFFSVSITIWSFGHKGRSENADCIIVLGAAAYGDKPSPVFEERIKHALTLHRRKRASALVFTGGYGDGASHAESEVASIYAQAHGIDESSIHIEKVSQTTRENLIEAKKLMDDQNFRSAIIVSDPLHLKRASMMAKDLGITATTSPTPTSRYRSFKTKFGFLIREVYFFHHYLLAGD